MSKEHGTLGGAMPLPDSKEQWKSKAKDKEKPYEYTMTQLEALVTLVDAVACLPENPQLVRALKKINERIEKLQDRRKRRLAGIKTMPL